MKKKSYLKLILKKTTNDVKKKIGYRKKNRLFFFTPMSQVFSLTYSDETREASLVLRIIELILSRCTIYIPIDTIPKTQGKACDRKCRKPMLSCIFSTD